MAVGIPFPESNLVLRAPTPEDAVAGTVYDLHVHRYRDLDGNPHVISKWQFQPEELAGVVANGGVFWFHAWGETHPPVGIEGQNPFVRAGTQAEQAAANREAVADPRLWCLHHIGPDDVHPAPDFATAQRWADWANEVSAGYADISRFVVAVWPWEEFKHADGLEQAIANWTVPAVPGQATELAPLQRASRDCTMCDDTGYKDYAGYGMDPCDHSQPTPAAPGDAA